VAAGLLTAGQQLLGGARRMGGSVLILDAMVAALLAQVFA
jgi:hypothetical protein